jgi:hypothetical protein
VELKAKIVDLRGNSLVGVNVYHYSKDDGSPKIALTNINGEFSVNVDDSKEIKISYAGFQEISLYPKEIKDEHIVLLGNNEKEAISIDDDFSKPISTKEDNRLISKKIPYGYITVGALILASAIYYFKIKNKWKV